MASRRRRARQVLAARAEAGDPIARTRLANSKADKWARRAAHAASKKLTMTWSHELTRIPIVPEHVEANAVRITLPTLRDLRPRLTRSEGR